ncbi:MAG: ABC transporter ATP-binding protein [Anaerolineaceae bacterium]|nr:ABC transporter ATP-binding protein [Anaerolineaceae bacterium]
MTEPILEVKNLSKFFEMPHPFFDVIRRIPAQKLVAVDDVSLKINRLETVGLVGESGCGKSTMARCILRLYEPSAGTIIFEGRDITRLPAAEMRTVRKRMQIVFQDPYSSLNPKFTVRKTLREVIRFHKICSPSEEEAYLEKLLKMVGLDIADADKYPKAFSGGQRQRIALARSLAVEPILLVGDEPVSALDVSIQAQILNLLADLRDELGLTMVFIAHELSVVKHVSTRVAVMYLGKIVELGKTEEVFGNPLHPYTEVLLAALPKPIPVRRHRKPAVEGDVPSPLNIPSGCRFHPRCSIADDICRKVEPPINKASEMHMVQCHLRPEPGWTNK